MRALWPIEREILELAASEYPAVGAALKQQIESVRVVSFENSGSGFFSHLVVADDAPLLTEASPLDPGHGTVAGIENGMGFCVFLTDGRLSMIDAYCNADESTAGIDFSTAVFQVMSWGPRILKV